MNPEQYMNAVIAAGEAVPSRRAIALNTATGASRPSRGRSDRVEPGEVVRTAHGYAIAESARKERGQEGFTIRITLRPPETDMEYLAVADRMYRDWVETTQHIAELDADMPAEQDALEEERKLRRRLIEELEAARRTMEGGK